MTDPDVFFSHAESTIYKLRKCLELIIIAHETGRHEPLQAAIEAAVIKVAEMGMPSPARTVLQGEMLAENERLRTALDDIFEMWAGSEGFIPHTAPEGYLLMLIKKMADRAALAKTEERSDGLVTRFIQR